jgi:lipid-binding SYLF domain-containing protein
VGWLVVLLFCFPASVAPGTEWQPDPSVKVERKAAAILERIRAKPKTERFFDEAYGYAVFPTITRFGFGFGGAYGKGVLFERGELVGDAKFRQFTSGIQAGVRVFGMVVLFEDPEAMEFFKRGRAEFVGQASATLATLGASADPSYHKGVAIFTHTKGGLMVEATISGVKFKYKPRDACDADSH